MADIDEFASVLFEEAKRFYELSSSSDTEEGRVAYLHAALSIAISSLEAHINAIADEMLLRKDLSVLERSILMEADFSLKNGEFVLTNSLKMYRTLDRFEFLYNRFGRNKLDKNLVWWNRLVKALDARNNLIHPKGKLQIDQATVASALEGILSALDSIYNSVYRKKYPAAGRKLNSKMVF